jgi:hypothetical protein
LSTAHKLADGGFRYVARAKSSRAQNPISLLGGLYVVGAVKDGMVEYWAAPTLQVNAVAAVEKQIGPAHKAPDCDATMVR